MCFKKKQWLNPVDSRIFAFGLMIFPEQGL